MEKALQIFTDEYLERCRELTTEQIVNFLEQFRQVAYAGQKTHSKQISLKVPEDLLEAFKFNARLQGRLYQSVIKDLMRDWLLKQNQE